MRENLESNRDFSRYCRLNKFFFVVRGYSGISNSVLTTLKYKNYITCIFNVLIAIVGNSFIVTMFNYCLTIIYDLTLFNMSSMQLGY